MRLLDLAVDSAIRTYSGAGGTAAAFVWINAVLQQRLTDACRTFLILDVCYVLVTEEVKC